MLVLVSEAIVLLEERVIVSLERLNLLREVFNYRVNDLFIALLDPGEAHTYDCSGPALVECGYQRVKAVTYHIQQMFIVWLLLAFIEIILVVISSFVVDIGPTLVYLSRFIILLISLLFRTVPPDHG